MILTKFVYSRGKNIPYEELKPCSKLIIDVKCDNCGKVFKSRKFQIIRNGHEFCQACALKLKNEKFLPIGSRFGRLVVIGPSSKTGHSMCLCDCGNTKDILNVSLKNGTTKSCGCLRSDNGKQIAAKYLNNYHNGEHHPNWKGGIAPKRNCIESTKEYKNWKQLVFKSANNRCQKCGSSENLEVHHIFNFKDYPEFRTDPSNGACLCSKCHRNFHSLYGRKCNNKEQFTDFISHS